MHPVFSKPGFSYLRYLQPLIDSGLLAPMQQDDPLFTNAEDAWKRFDDEERRGTRKDGHWENNLDRSSQNSALDDDDSHFMMSGYAQNAYLGFIELFELKKKLTGAVSPRVFDPNAARRNLMVDSLCEYLCILHSQEIMADFINQGAQAHDAHIMLGSIIRRSIDVYKLLTTETRYVLPSDYGDLDTSRKSLSEQITRTTRSIISNHPASASIKTER